MNSKFNTHIVLEQIIAQVTQLIAASEAHAFQQDGFAELSMRQVSYMDAIARLESPRLSELAEALAISRPSVTVLVDKLADKGFVQKVQDGQDRRAFHIVPTEKGLQFAQIHAAIHRQIVEALVARLDEGETEQLAALLMKALGT